MEKKHSPEDNLIPTSERTKEEARELGRKGGIASGKARREKKQFAQIYAEMLAETYNVNVDGIGREIEGTRFLKIIIRDILMRRDNASVSMIKEMADRLGSSQDDILDKLTRLLTQIEQEAED